MPTRNVPSFVKKGLTKKQWFHQGCLFLGGGLLMVHLLYLFVVAQPLSRCLRLPSLYISIVIVFGLYSQKRWIYHLISILSWGLFWIGVLLSLSFLLASACFRLDVWINNDLRLLFYAKRLIQFAFSLGILLVFQFGWLWFWGKCRHHFQKDSYCYSLVKQIRFLIQNKFNWKVSKQSSKLR